MAKTLRMPCPPPTSVFKKASSEAMRAKLSVGCTLHELCTEDKNKVAKLLRQVVELERELTHCKAQSKKERNESEQKTQHLRQQSGNLLLENNTLKAKLTHAFALLRAYQHKVKSLTAAPTESDVHKQHDWQLNKPQQSHCHQCRQPALLNHRDTSGKLAMHNGQLSSSLQAPALRPNEAYSSSHQSSDTGIQCHHQSASAHNRHTDGPQQAHDPLNDPRLHASDAIARQESSAQLANEVMAWQQDDAASETAQHAAAQEACKVLRFDPSLGTDGAFYFITSGSFGLQTPPASEQLDGPPSADALQRHQKAASAVIQQQHSGPVECATTQQLQLPDPGSGQTAKAAQSDKPGGNEQSLESSKASSAQPVCTAPKSVSASLMQAGQTEEQPVHGHRSDTTGEQQAAMQAQPLFPVQGGGEAGVLLRAAAAAAVGCSHELVVAAAGRASSQEDSCSGGRPGSHHEMRAQPAAAAANGCSVAAAAHSGQEQLRGSAGAEPTGDPATKERQSVAEIDRIVAAHEPWSDASAGRVDEDLQSLGFDSSLMDLVAEVEQMVAFKQANAGPADRQPAGRQHLSPRAALLHRLPSTQGLQDDEDFEENDVISLISDQEYSMY